MHINKKISIAAASVTVLLILIFASLNVTHIKSPVYMLLTGQTDFAQFTSLVHDTCVSETPGKYAFVDLNGLFMRLTGRRVDNGVMKLRNGMLTEANTPVCDASAMAKGINELAEYTSGKGIDFLYVQLPYKLDKSSELVIEGKSDHSNENADALLELLDDNADRIDLRPMLSSTPEAVEESFFITDHHWNYYGAFRGFGEILRELDRRFPDSGIDLSCGDIDNWEAHTVENWLLGSRGRRTGQYFAGLDDLTYYTPKFETHISCSIPETGEYYEGDFTEANIRAERISGDKDPYEKNAYCMYMGEDYGFVEQRSSAAGKLKVLLIKESFALPLQAYFSTAFECVYSVDPRYTGGKSVGQYIDELSPDIVLLTLNPNIIHLCPEDFSSFVD